MPPVAVDPARDQFISFYDKFLAWAPGAITTRAQMTADFAELRARVYAGVSAYELCKANMTTPFNEWRPRLVRSPDSALNALYTAMTKTLGDAFLTCVNSATPYDRVHPILDQYQGLVDQESTRLYDIHAQAERWGVAWRWPQGLAY